MVVLYCSRRQNASSLCDMHHRIVQLFRGRIAVTGSVGFRSQRPPPVGRWPSPAPCRTLQRSRPVRPHSDQAAPGARLHARVARSRSSTEARSARRRRWTPDRGAQAAAFLPMRSPDSPLPSRRTATPHTQRRTVPGDPSLRSGSRGSWRSRSAPDARPRGRTTFPGPCRSSPRAPHACRTLGYR